MRIRFPYQGRLIHPILFIAVIYFVYLLIVAAPFTSLTRDFFKLFWGDRTYLIVFQNNYELRPTGGFISAFALFNIKNGAVSLQFEDVYGTVDDHPFVAPPRPLGELLGHPTYSGHTFRDANVNPDFPSSAIELTAFLRKTRPFQKIDGVIAVDTSLLERIVRAVGSVNILGERFNEHDLVERLEHRISDVDLHDVSERSSRKNVLKSLGVRLAVKSLFPWNFPSVLRAIRKALDEKHMVLYFDDGGLQEKARALGWTGEMNLEPGTDFLGVIDANYGGGKSNRYVTRGVFYNVDLERGTSSLDIRYDHPGEYSLPLSTDYRGYVRVYVPADHTITGAEFSGSEGAFSYGGKIVRVPILSSRQLHFEMSFPPSTFDDLAYRLFLRKQPGTLRDLYHVQVRVPSGMQLESDSFEVRENVAVWQGSLDRDLELSFDLKPDPLPPRVIHQELSHLNELQMEWNEGIEPGSLRPEKWSVADTNTVSSATDAVAVESFDVRGRTLVIRTRGMTPQPEERYVLEISGVRDFRNNEIRKRTYTFYQRLVE